MNSDNTISSNTAIITDNKSELNQLLDSLDTYLWCLNVEKARGKRAVNTKAALSELITAYDVLRSKGFSNE